MAYYGIPSATVINTGLRTAGYFSIRSAQKVVFDGDSVTAGQHAGVGGDSTYRWCAPFEALVTNWFTGWGFTGPTYANVAVGGATTTDMLTAVANVTGQTPDHVICMIGINDHFNHGGTAIPPSTSQSNVASYISTIKSSRPSVRFHFIRGVFYNTENYPDGVGTDDAAVLATMAAIQIPVQAEPQAEWLDIRTPMYSSDAPYQNPGHSASGIMTQDGCHPTINLGQMMWSKRVFERMSLGQ